MSNIITIWEERNDKPFIKFAFLGHLNEQLSAEAISKMGRLLAISEKNGEKVSIIWNCEKMTGYESKARLLWQKALKDHIESIDEVWIVTTNPMFKLAAKTMTLLTKYNLKVATTESQIDQVSHKTV